MWRLLNVSLLLVIAAAAVLAQEVTTGDPMYDRFREVGDQLECQCGCSSTIARCNMLYCSFREKVKPTIFEGIEAGLSNEEIIENVVAQFGNELRTAPRAEGFGMVGWAMPFVALLMGLIVAPVVVHRWKKKNQAAPPKQPVSQEAVERYNELIEKEIEEME